MHVCRRSVSIQRRSLVGALAFMALLLSSCGLEGRTNPLAPNVGATEQTGTLAVVAKNSKPKHGHGNTDSLPRTQTSSGGAYAGGVTSGGFGGDPGTESPADPFITE
jgi:hypothetical protein